jgi:cobaltochelatase CobT
VLRGREAKDAYDALEQARVEVVGAQHMLGVHGNLRAKLAEECEQEGFDRMTRKDQMPIDKALALLARERCPGESPEPEGRNASCRCGARRWATTPTPRSPR